MKTRPFACLLLVLACALADVGVLPADARDFAAEMSVNADVQAEFFKKYPDLQDEGDLVAREGRAMASGGLQPQDDAAAAEILARRVRALLANRTEPEWKQKAMSLYPELAVQGSPFNTLFVRRVNEMKKKGDQFLKEPSWPLLLARRCADELHPKTSVASAPAQAGQKTAGTDSSISTSATTPKGRRTPWWASALSLLVLLAIVVQPARLLWRCRRAFGGSAGPVTIWQRALGPAAWVYLVVALIGLFRTFMANADQPLLDRSVVALFVSVIAGAVCALPAYGLAFGAMWWSGRRISLSPQFPDRAVAEPEALPVGRPKS